MDSFENNGFLLLKKIVSDEQIEKLKNSIDALNSLPSAPGVRHLLRRSLVVRRLANSPELLSIAGNHLGLNAKPVKAIFFDKTPASNWYVTWHQDLTIAVKQKIDVAGYGPWSTKDLVAHVQPPASVLEQMLAIRIHLDACTEENGAINFIPGSHKSGKLNNEDIGKWKERKNFICCSAEKGDVIVMRPLILHSSSKASKPGHRRVLHIEYAAVDLAAGLEWNEASGLDGVELLMAIEEEFGLEIPDNVAEQLHTVGETYEYLLMRLNSTPASECLSQRIFYKLRRALINNFQVKRSSIEPDTKLSEILSLEELENGWPYLPLFIEMNTPDFKRANEFMGFKLNDDMLTVRQLVQALISLNWDSFSKELNTDQEIWRRLVEVVVRQTSVNPSAVVPSAKFASDLGVC